MSEPDVPNPFESAKRVSGVHVRLRPEDLINAVPGLRIEAVHRLLDRHGGTIAAAMLNAGIEAAVAISKQEGAGS